MKKLITTNIVEGVRKLGAVKAFFEFMEAAYTESFKEFIFGLLASTNSPTSLHGCVNVGSGSNYNISAGAIWYNGEVFLIPALVGVAPGAQVPVLVLVETKTQLAYTDFTNQDTLNNRTLAWQFGASGSGIVNFADLLTLRARIDVLTDLPARLIAAKTEVKNEILNGAGASLDTLKELADALGNDANFAATVIAGLANKVPMTRLISTGAGLTGGGDLSADRTFSIPNSGVSEAMLADRYLKVRTAANNLNYEKIALGNWDMQTVGGIKVPLAGITTFDKVRFLSAFIFTDAMDNVFNFGIATNTFNVDAVMWAAGEAVFGPNHIYMNRKLTGFFDSTSFASASMNRGYLIVGYEP